MRASLGTQRAVGRAIGVGVWEFGGGSALTSPVLLLQLVDPLAVRVLRTDPIRLTVVGYAKKTP